MSQAQAVTERPRTRSRGKSRPRSRLRRALQPLFLLILIAILLPLVLVPLYRFVNPPVTTVMLAKALVGAGIDKRWTDIDEISPRLIGAVLTSEDSRFCAHGGIDWVEVQNALDDGDGRLRGASTITMQTVKNLFLWTGRSWIRKGLEVPLAFYAELFLPKRRILEIYLNVAEWDSGVYGAGAAAEHYFGVTAAKLSAMQAARLAAVLPSPTTRDAANPGPGTARLARRIAARGAAADTTCITG